MMFFSQACKCLALVLLLSPSATAESIRGRRAKVTDKRKTKAAMTPRPTAGPTPKPTSPPGGLPSVSLGFAEDYVILAKTGIATVPTSAITGDIAVSPIDGTAMTGFSMTLASDGTFSSSNQVVGKCFAANYATPTPATLTVAIGAMEAAYTEAAGLPNADASRINPGAGVLGGVVGGANNPLTPGVYTFGSGVTISGDLYFAGTNNAQVDDVFVIQVSGALAQAKNTKVILSNGARAENIFWQISGNVVVKAGAHMEGVLLVKTDVTFVTGSSLKGRVLTQTACNLQKATITQP